MKVLVTGAAGFIGSHAAEQLKQDGHEVLGVDSFSDYYSVHLKLRNQAALYAQGIPIHSGNLAKDELSAILTSDFDYIIHFAAQPGISSEVGFQDYLDNNVLATQRLINFAGRNKSLKMFINISTSSVYGINATGREDAAPSPVSFYGVTKLAAEQLVLKEARLGKIPACSLRLYSVYGPRERPDKLYTKLINAAIQRHHFSLFNGSDGHIRSFTYVDDIVAGILSVMGKENVVNGEVINLGTTVENTTAYGISCVEQIMNTKIIIEHVAKRAGDQLHTRADITKAQALLDYCPGTMLYDGLAKQVEWQLAQ